MVFPDVAVNFKVPLLWVNVPALENEPPIANIPDGMVSVPAVIMTLLDEVALVSTNDQLPLPLKARLKNGDAPT